MHRLSFGSMRRLGLPSLLLLVLIVACGGSHPDRTPLGARASCHADSDCTLVDRVSCCSACADRPRAIPVTEAEEQRRSCAAESCPAASPRIECRAVPALSGFRARCDQGTCAAIPR